MKECFEIAYADPLATLLFMCGIATIILAFGSWSQP